MANTIQNIQRGGRVVALVIAGHAIVVEDLEPRELPHVQAMALYAIKIADGEITGAYTDARAERYAAHTLARVCARRDFRGLR